jgi:hypothetical protein
MPTRISTGICQYGCLKVWPDMIAGWPMSRYAQTHTSGNNYTAYVHDMLYLQLDHGVVYVLSVLISLRWHTARHVHSLTVMCLMLYRQCTWRLAIGHYSRYDKFNIINFRKKLCWFVKSLSRCVCVCVCVCVCLSTRLWTHLSTDLDDTLDINLDYCNIWILINLRTIWTLLCFYYSPIIWSFDLFRCMMLPKYIII